MQGRLILRNAKDTIPLKVIGIYGTTYKYFINEMASGNTTFAATGVTYGAKLHGVKTTANGIIIHSMVTRSETGTFRYIKAYHGFARRVMNG